MFQARSLASQLEKTIISRNWIDYGEKNQRETKDLEISVVENLRSSIAFLYYLQLDAASFRSNAQLTSVQSQSRL